MTGLGIKTINSCKIKPANVLNFGNKTTLKKQEPDSFTAKKPSFGTVEEAQDYVKETLGIDAHFINTKQANLVIEALEDFAKMGHGEKLRGMKIGIEAAAPSKLGSLHIYYYIQKRYNLEMKFNRKYDWENIEKRSEELFKAGSRSSGNPKVRIYHEIAHYLDFMNNPDIFYTLHNMEFTKKEKDIARQVSGYAKKGPLEFKAEYIAARIAGKDYRPEVHKLYEEYRGPELYD